VSRIQRVLLGTAAERLNFTGILWKLAKLDCECMSFGVDELDARPTIPLLKSFDLFE
jgi:hypothetical protein